MKLGISGSRNGLSKSQEEYLINFVKNNNIKEFHHGDCVGVDEQSHKIIENYSPNTKIIVHPPDKDILRKFCQGYQIRKPLSYLNRNKKIVEDSDYILTFPSPDSKGTWHVISYAKSQNKLGEIVFNDGKLKKLK